VSVVAPPPEVERPYDLSWEPSAERVVRYRTYARTNQLRQLLMTVAMLVVATVVCVAGDQSPWEPSVGGLAGQTLLYTLVFMILETIWEGRGLRRRLEAAEPLPDGAHEIGMSLRAPTFLLGGIVLGAVFGGGALIFGDTTSALVVALAAGMGVGRILGRELVLRLIVERADPARTFFVALDDELPLLWRPA